MMMLLCCIPLVSGQIMYSIIKLTSIFLLVGCTAGVESSSDTSESTVLPGDSTTDTTRTDTGDSSTDTSTTTDSDSSTTEDSGLPETGGADSGDGGSSDTGPGLLADADAVVLGEDVNMFFGMIVANADDVDGDGYMDMWIGPDMYEPHAAYLFRGPLTGEVTSASADLRVTSSGGDLFPLSMPVLTCAGDVDADGTSDALFGAPGAGDAEDGGAILVLSPSIGELYLEDGDAMLWGEEAEAETGFGVAGPGDVNGDGWDDLLIGAPWATVSGASSDEGHCPDSDADEFDDAGGLAAGKVFLTLGPVSGEHSTSEADAALTGEDGYDTAGFPATVGDLDGDGLDDILVRAPGQCEGAERGGAMYVVLGPISGTRGLADADGKVIDTAHSMVISGAGDVDGDGTPDILWGAPSAVRGGLVHLILGPALGDQTLDDAAIASLEGEDSRSFAGVSVSAAGDINSDGFADILVGDSTNQTGGTSAGAAFIVPGPVAGTYSLSDAGLKVIGSESDYAGHGVAGLGDTNADGLPDVLIGAIGADLGGDSAGAAHLLLGGGSVLGSL